jgi:hypothetical protein
MSSIANGPSPTSPAATSSPATHSSQASTTTGTSSTTPSSSGSGGGGLSVGDKAGIAAAVIGSVFGVIALIFGFGGMSKTWRNFFCCRSRGTSDEERVGRPGSYPLNQRTSNHNHTNYGVNNGSNHGVIHGGITNIITNIFR